MDVLYPLARDHIDQKNGTISKINIIIKTHPLYYANQRHAETVNPTYEAQYDCEGSSEEIKSAMSSIISVIDSDISAYYPALLQTNSLGILNLRAIVLDVEMKTYFHNQESSENNLMKVVLKRPLRE